MPCVIWHSGAGCAGRRDDGLRTMAIGIGAIILTRAGRTCRRSAPAGETRLLT